MKKISLPVFLLFGGIPWLSSGQTVMKQPEIITRGEKRISVNCLLGKTGNQLGLPWVVFSDRDNGETRMGDRFFVVNERETELRVYQASGCRDRKLAGGRDKGWKSKSDLLVCFGADFTDNSMIHRKCVILNHHQTIERIKQGEVSESEVPVYRSSTSQIEVDHVPLYLIYFVYKTENNRYLLGRDFRFDPDLPFFEQIIGWVDHDRVFDYDNRVCFEPNSDEVAVAYRRCHPAYAARVFGYESDLGRYIGGDTTIRPIWVEPDYYFFRNPKYKTGSPRNGESLDIAEKNFTPDYLDRLCNLEGDPQAIHKSQILTDRPLPGNKFRFPLIRMESTQDNVFMTGVTGRFENENKTRSMLCEALKSHKSQVSVYFILDQAVDRNRLTYVIGQIQQEYTGIRKSYGVCFYPRLQLGKYKVTLGENSRNNPGNNYEYIRDYIRDFSADTSLAIRSDNALNTLKFVLTNEAFDSRQTNIIVLINNHRISVPDAGFAGLRKSISNLMVEKNCYLLAFDYQGDNGLVQQLQEISIDAGTLYAERLDIHSRDLRFETTGIGHELVNAGLLAIIRQTDTARLDVPQMQDFLKKGYDRIVLTIDDAIQQICQKDPVPRSPDRNRHEDPFLKALRDLPGLDNEVQYIRALEEGYAAMKYRRAPGESEQEIWKANVLMTKPELEVFASLLDKISVQTNNSNFSRSVYDLWTALFNRFVGDNLPVAEILSMTPQVIMNRILGAPCGYALSDPLKRFTLERILANDQQVQPFFEEYRYKLISCRVHIKEMLSTGRMKFNLDEDPGRTSQALANKGICYYWVPMDILP